MQRLKLLEAMEPADSLEVGDAQHLHRADVQALTTKGRLPWRPSRRLLSPLLLKDGLHTLHHRYSS